MSAILKNENGPAEGATSPDRGSITHLGDAEMNRHDNTTAPTEGATKITRRSALGLITAAAVPSVGVAAVSAAASEAPEAKVRRLSRELSEAMTDYNGGRWYATIYPPLAHPFPVSFGVIDLHETQEQKVKRLLLNLQHEMSKLPGRLGDGLRLLPLDREGRSFARYMPRDETSGDDSEMIFAVLRPMNGGVA